MPSDALRLHPKTPWGTSAADFLPERLTLPALVRAARHCEGCPLYQRATQTVFGEGPIGAELMLVGECPGDQEDVQGKPFVGPAGKLLDGALEEIGITRRDVYLTNAVKHFKWEPRGKRRLHGKPSAREVAACQPWLEAEFKVVHPHTIVCLGATAARVVFGPSFRLTRQRGELLPTPKAAWALATYHPSAVLRAPDRGERMRLRDLMVSDLRTALEAAMGKSR